MCIRGIAFDLDGTLLNNQKEITPTTRKCLGEMQAAGVKIVLATGRNDVYVKGLAQQIGGIDAIIACNGALIRDMRSWEKIKQTPITASAANELADFALREQLDFTMSIDGAMLCVEGSQRAQIFVQYNASMPEHLRVPIHSIRTLDDIEGHTILKMFLWNMSTEKEERFSQCFEGNEHIRIFVSEKNGTDIQAVGADKGNALEFLSDFYRISLEEFAAFGDYANDIGMLNKVGWSFAMGNASEEVKRHARYTTKSNEEDGVAWAIAHWLLPRVRHESV